MKIRGNYRTASALSDYYAIVFNDNSIYGIYHKFNSDTFTDLPDNCYIFIPRIGWYNEKQRKLSISDIPNEIKTLTLLLT